MFNQQAVDAGLAIEITAFFARKAALAHVHPGGLGGEGAQGRIGQRVEQHDRGLAQALHATQGDEVGGAGARPDEMQRHHGQPIAVAQV